RVLIGGVAVVLPQQPEGAVLVAERRGVDAAALLGSGQQRRVHVVDEGTAGAVGDRDADRLTVGGTLPGRVVGVVAAVHLDHLGRPVAAAVRPGGDDGLAVPDPPPGDQVR